MRDQLSSAAHHAAASDRDQSALIDAYASPGSKRHQIAGLHQSINYHLKRAEVAALVAIAQRLDDLGISR